MNELSKIIEDTVKDVLSELKEKNLYEEIPQRDDEEPMWNVNVTEGVNEQSETKILPPRSAEQVMGVVITNGTNSPLKITSTEHITSVGDQSVNSYFIKIEPPTNV